MEVKAYKVIYDLLDDMRAVMEGQLSTVEERIPLGLAEVSAACSPRICVETSSELHMSGGWCGFP